MMNNENPLKDRIHAFIASNFYVEPGAFGDDDSLLRRRILDSTGVLEVAMFLEDELGVRVEDVDMVPENMASVAAISSFVERKRAAKVAKAG